MKYVFYLLLFLSLNNAFADNFLWGADSTIYLGNNTSTISSTDSAVLNPAGLSAIHNKSLNTGATIIGFTDYSDRDTENSTTNYPSFVSKSFTILSNWGVEIFYAKPYSIEIKKAWKEFNVGENTDGDIKYKVDTHFLGVGLGTSINKDFNVGFSLNLAMVNADYSFEAISYTMKDDRDGNIVWNFDNDGFQKEVSFYPILGIQYSVNPNINFGGSLNFGGFLIDSENNQESSTSYVSIEEEYVYSQQTIEKTNGETKEVENKMNILLSGSYHFSKFNFHLRTSYSDSRVSKNKNEVSTKTTTTLTYEDNDYNTHEYEHETNSVTEKDFTGVIWTFGGSVDYQQNDSVKWVFSHLVDPSGNNESDKTLLQTYAFGRTATVDKYKTTVGVIYSKTTVSEYNENNFNESFLDVVSGTYIF